MKDKILDILEELESDVQFMRENGEGDLRSVLHFIHTAIHEINKLKEDK